VNCCFELAPERLSNRVSRKTPPHQLVDRFIICCLSLSAVFYTRQCRTQIRSLLKYEEKKHHFLLFSDPENFNVGAIGRPALLAIGFGYPVYEAAFGVLRAKKRRIKKYIARNKIFFVDTTKNCQVPGERTV